MKNEDLLVLINYKNIKIRTPNEYMEIVEKTLS